MPSSTQEKHKKKREKWFYFIFSAPSATQLSNTEKRESYTHMSLKNRGRPGEK
jgi:hypothetical protein